MVSSYGRRMTTTRTSRGPRPRRLTALPIASALLVMLMAWTGAGPAHAEPSASRNLLAPGRVLAQEPLPAELWLPSTADAYRLHYLSTGWFGLPTVASGAVFVPEGLAPATGWPVVSWAHGTVGVADVCAPSTAGGSDRDVAYLTAWLQAGYAVVSTDYQGLGTVGRHPYLDGRSAAYDMTDMVRAARGVDRSLSATWFAVGQSQGGHAALFAGALAPTYAPELDFRGAIATAPPTQWRMTVTDTGALGPERPANPVVIDVVAGLETTHPFTFDADDYLTEAGRSIYDDALRTDCFPATAARTAGLLNGAVFDIDAAEGERLIRLLEGEDIPIGAYERPVYIAQGTADTVVYPPATQTTAEDLLAAGTDVTFATYEGADHSGVLAAALPDLLAWTQDQLQ